MKQIAFCTLGLAAMLTTACTDHSDLYDSEYANAKKQLEYAENFPVENIDPNQDWNLFTDATINVTVNEDWGETYTVKVYTANPLDENAEALILTKGEVKNGETFSAQLSIPKDLESVYVSRLNSKNQKLTKYVPVNGTSLDVNFGAVETRAYSGSNPYVTVEPESCPYTEEQIQQWLSEAVEVDPTWTDMKNEWHDGFEDGGIYKYSQDANYNGVANLTGGNMIFLITDGATVKVDPNNSPNAGCNVIVVNGTLQIEGNTTNFGNADHLVILPDGKLNVTGTDQATLAINNYNAGTISGTGVYYSYLYNVGTIDVIYLTDKSWEGGTILKNFGHINVTENFNAKHGSVYNNCYMKIKNADDLGNFFLADNTQFDVTGQVSFGQNETITLGKSSIFNVNKFYSNNGVLQAPEAGSDDLSEYAYVKIAKVVGANFGDYSFKGNYVIDPGDISDNSTWITSSAIAKAGVVQAELTVTSPAEDECIGTVDVTEMTPEEVEEEEEKEEYDYVYFAFEDLGSIGDYDFNDVIVKLSATANDWEFKVQLVAAGGTLPVAVANRYSWETSGGIIWDDVHGADAFNTPDVVNVGTDTFISNYPTKIIPREWQGEPASGFSKLLIIVQNESGTSQQLASTIVYSQSTTGEAPQCLKIPAGWKWPKEFVNICKAYGTTNFSVYDWAQDASKATSWYKNVASGYEDLVVTPQ
jgi:hypothetical protein